MPRRPLPDDLAGSAFTTGAARALGIERGRLRGRDLVHPHHGIHIDAASAADADIVSRCERLIPALGPDDWFSHRTAARIWGIPVEPAYSAVEGLHVMTVGRRYPVRHSGIIGRVTADDALPREMWGTLPVVSPAAVWSQLAQRGAVTGGELIAFDWLVAAADYALTGKRGADGVRQPALCTPEDLRAEIVRLGTGRGTAMLRAALDCARFPVDSPYETLVRRGLVAEGLPEPHVQVPVVTSEGLRHADVGYPAERLLIEYQGDAHRASRRRWLSDLRRVQLLQEAGYDVLLIGYDDVVPDCKALASRVRRALQRQTAR
ncbi:hypothetical protein IF188_03260 [Microbacterium sp. NEAU-LLC]|uniref:DUF559 domain-containing protein n=1 Tax=Microbacterium helvum TaxID=2773713 RepID=A0ABR8NLS0_9MICO|nr:hypothetical protein [Microbacterium helvum]MBD3940717.1 hypothetical protein [Microbacterium helvum]